MLLDAGHRRISIGVLRFDRGNGLATHERKLARNPPLRDPGVDGAFGREEHRVSRAVVAVHAVHSMKRLRREFRRRLAGRYEFTDAPLTIGDAHIRNRPVPRPLGPRPPFPPPPPP